MYVPNLPKVKKKFVSCLRYMQIKFVESGKIEIFLNGSVEISSF